MASTVSRQLFSRLLFGHSKKNMKHLINVRLKSNTSSNENKLEAAVLKKYSEPLQIEILKSPNKLDSTEVLIDVNYCALNGLDVLMSENLYSHKTNLPFILGYEVSGKLIEVGEKAKQAGYNVGDKVIALNKERFGGLANHCVAEMNDVWKIPTSIKSVDGVCLLENYMTALIGLEVLGSIQEEDIILVNVGIGGIGLAAVDIAANIYRAKVIGVGSSTDRLDKIRERGAFQALTYKEKQLVNTIAEFAEERDIKNVFDGEQGKIFKKVLNGFMKIYESKVPPKYLLQDNNFGVVVQKISDEGRIIIAGSSGMNKDDKEDDEKKEKSDDKKKITKSHDEKKNEFFATGIDLKDYKKRKNEFYRVTGEEVISFFEEGLIKPSPSMIVGLYGVNQALKFISEMKACGKVLIDLKNKEADPKIF